MDSTHYPAPSAHGGLREVGRLLVAVLAGAVAGAFGVFILTRAEVGAAEDGREDALADAAAARARGSLLAAELAVDDAIEDLQQRNFGLAMDALDRAGLQLSAVRQSGAKEPLLTQVETLRSELDDVRLNVANDVDTQVRRLDDVEGRLDDLARGEQPPA